MNGRRVDQQVRALRALAHPMRLRVLHAFVHDGCRSPVEATERLGFGYEKIGHVGYHVRVLFENGLLRADGTRMVRGAVQHFYKPTERAAKLLKLLEDGWGT